MEMVADTLLEIEEPEMRDTPSIQQFYMIYNKEKHLD